MTDAKKRAQDGLDGLVDECIDTLGKSVKGLLVLARGSTRTVDARYILDYVLEREVDESAQSPSSVMSTDELAVARERLRQARQGK